MSGGEISRHEGNRSLLLPWHSSAEETMQITLCNYILEPSPAGMTVTGFFVHVRVGYHIWDKEAQKLHYMDVFRLWKKDLFPICFPFLFYSVVSALDSQKGSSRQ